jgi:transposase-like protein
MTRTPRRTPLEPVQDDAPRPAPTAAPAQGRAATGRFESKYDPAHCAAIIEHMASGASATSFAASIGVRPETLRAWADQHEEFAQAKDLAFARCQAWWEQRLREGLFDRVESTGSGKDRSMSTTRLNANVARLVMQNLFNWSDKQMSEVLERRDPLESVGVRPYAEWESHDLRTLQGLMMRYRRTPDAHAPEAPIDIEQARPIPRRRPVPDDDDVALN